MELTELDKTRIQQWARGIADSIGRPDDGNETRARIDGAEYATIYERQSFNETRNTFHQLNKKLMDDIIALKVSEQEKEIKELKYWKKSEMKLWGPLIEYAQNTSK